MGDSAAAAGGPVVPTPSHDDPTAHHDANKGPSHLQQPHQQHQHQQRVPFHSQFEVIYGQPQQHQQQIGHYAANPYNMAAMANTLPPQTNPQHMPPRSMYEQEPNPTLVSSTGPRSLPQHGGYRGLPMDPNAFRAVQQQQFLAPVPPFSDQAGSHQPLPPQRGQIVSGQSPEQFSQMYHPYALQYTPIGFATQAGAQMSAPLPADVGKHQYTRRASEPAPVPSFPRGPPRKPKQSGHALWVGNLPPAATVTDLKDHFSRDATKDIESLFLISKSNCAFVNYRSEAACVAAMNRFHDSRFHGVRLVCRLRRGSASNNASSPTVPELARVTTAEKSGGTSSPNHSNGEPECPVIVGTPKAEQKQVAGPSIPREIKTQDGKVLEKFFIVKSLTVQDLEASVRNGIWATQSHNEMTLNQAYDQAENVYLIFSANKSGEYFGYARMSSPIAGEPVNLSPATADSEDTKLTGTPKSISTAPTETAPRGKIIDDSARGTIFWEAEHSDDEGGDAAANDESNGPTSQNWGRQFSIEWMSTAKLPFFRTRGLRNPWNANREVKIARDGTELEPSVGRRLVQMFHRPPPLLAAGVPASTIPALATSLATYR